MTEQAVKLLQVVATPDTAVGEQAIGLVSFVNAAGEAVVLTAAPVLTAADAEAGTATVPSVISAKVLADEIDRRVALAMNPAG